jgi:hypothetical protein
MNSKSKAPGNKRLKLKYDHLLSSVAVSSNTRRYILPPVFTLKPVRRQPASKSTVQLQVKVPMCFEGLVHWATFANKVGRCRLNL